MQGFKRLPLLLALTASGPTTVGAATVVFTDRADWESAVSGAIRTEDFSDAVLNTGLSFVSSESGHVNPALGYYQDVLASTSANAPSTTWGFVPESLAFGGTWTLGGPGGSGNSLQVYVDETIWVGGIANSYSGGFWGFVSDTPFATVRLIGGSGTHQQTYQLDDMVYSPVPLPAAAWLLGTTILGIGAIARRQAKAP